jgi:hypothetical protein
MVGLDFTLKGATVTKKLNVPDGLQNTKDGREAWVIDPSPISPTIALLAAVPAFLVFM